MTTLYIDTTDNKNVFIKVVHDGKEHIENAEKTERPESVLLLLDRLFKREGLMLSSIDEISVNEGPGSYTGLKVGVSIANALSFALQKNVNQKSLGEQVLPTYE